MLSALFVAGRTFPVLSQRYRMVRGRIGTGIGIDLGIGSLRGSVGTVE